MPGVLIVDDEKGMRKIINISLTRRKFEVFEAENGRDAISHFKPSITDLVITDLIMPEEDGLEVIMKLRKLKPTIKIIAISGGGIVGPRSYLDMAKVLGADAVYSKPFSINNLVLKIEELLKIEQHN